MIDIAKFHNETQNSLEGIGVYKIISKHNNKVYIGSTSNISKYKKWSGFKLRWLHHISSLLKNKHSNNLLQNIVNKYGIENLFFEIIEICEKDICIEREQYYIDLYNSYNEGLNLRPIANSNLGIKQSIESNLKRSISISKTLKEKYSKEEHHRKGFIMDDVHKENLSKSKRSVSDEVILSINSRMLELTNLKYIKSNIYEIIENEFNVKIDTLRRIINGKWNNLDWSFILKRAQIVNNEVINEIIYLYSVKGESTKKIGMELKMSQQNISYWVKKLELVKSKL